jgi:hypothetical protein
MEQYSAPSSASTASECPLSKGPRQTFGPQQNIAVGYGEPEVVFVQSQHDRLLDDPAHLIGE